MPPDYVCPECGCGFTEKHGKRRTRSPVHDIEDRLTRWTWLIAESIAMRRWYVIVCPNCGHNFGERQT